MCVNAACREAARACWFVDDKTEQTKVQYNYGSHFTGGYAGLRKSLNLRVIGFLNDRLNVRSINKFLFFA